MTTIDDLGNHHGGDGKFSEKGQAPGDPATFPDASPPFGGIWKAKNEIDALWAREQYIEDLQGPLANPEVKFVIADRSSRSDRVYLTGYNANGEEIEDDTLYVNDADAIYPSEPAEFAAIDDIPAGLEDMVYDGLMDADVVRNWDLKADRLRTQESVLFLSLNDMASRGDAVGYVVTKGTVEDSIEGSVPESDVASVAQRIWDEESFEHEVERAAQDGYYAVIDQRLAAIQEEGR